MIEVQIGGLDEVRRALRDVPEKLRTKYLRQALRRGMTLVRDEARKAAPVIDAGSPALRRRKHRPIPGTLRRAIVVRTGKRRYHGNDNVVVFVNVRPAKRGEYYGPKDAFYWRFVEFGTRRGVRARQFLQKGAQQLRAAGQRAMDEIVRVIRKMNEKAGA